MFARVVFAAIVALLLGGCTGWAAESPLIPVAERDAIGLSGTYAAGSDSFTINPGEDGLYLIAEGDTEDGPAAVAFVLLRAETAEDAIEGATPDQTYLMEVQGGDAGKAGVFYHIVTIADGGGGTASGSFAFFHVLCSEAAKQFARRVKDEVCVFDDYARLNAAAFDALAWYDEARMEVAATAYSRVEKADALEGGDF